MDTMQQQGKMEYVKPEVFDLGAVTPAIGGTCQPAGNLPSGKLGCASPGLWVAICNTGSTGGQTL